MKDDSTDEVKWRQIEAGIRQTFSRPQNAAKFLIEFLVSVRDGAPGAPVANGDSKAIKDLKTEIANLKESVAALTAKIDAVQESTPVTQEPVATPKPETSPAKSVTDGI